MSKFKSLKRKSSISKSEVAIKASRTSDNILSKLELEKPKIIEFSSESFRDIDIFANVKNTFKGQYEHSRKIILRQLSNPKSEGATLWIHGIGSAQNRAINLALQLVKSDDKNSVAMTVLTDTEMFLTEDENERERSVIHIRLDFKHLSTSFVDLSDAKDM